MNPSLACVKLTYQKVGIRRTNAMLNPLAVLQAVADAGSITHAAAQVGMTQSGASQAIAQLEDSMGAPLFLRERRRTVPTAGPAGGGRGPPDAGFAGPPAGVGATGGEAGARCAWPACPSCSPYPAAAAAVPAGASGHRGRAAGGQRPRNRNAAGGRHGGPGRGAERAAGQRRLPCWARMTVAVVPPRIRWRADPAAACVLADLAAQPFVLATGGCSVNAGSVAEQAGLAVTCAPRSRNGPAPSRWCAAA